jgi:DUF971 family protein
MHRCVEVRIGSAERALWVSFSDGTNFRIPHELLRVFSPSAEVRCHDGSWDIPPRRRGVLVKKAEPVGNYALRLCFDDGHDTGLYSFELLHDLGTNKFKHMREYVRELKRQGKARRRLVSKKT